MSHSSESYPPRTTSGEWLTEWSVQGGMGRGRMIGASRGLLSGCQQTHLLWRQQHDTEFLFRWLADNTTSTCSGSRGTVVVVSAIKTNTIIIIMERPQQNRNCPSSFYHPPRIWRETEIVEEVVIQRSRSFEGAFWRKYSCVILGIPFRVIPAIHINWNRFYFLRHIELYNQLNIEENGSFPQ